MRFRFNKCNYSNNKVSDNNIALKPGSYNLTKYKEN
jgi:hypothetical protein